MLNKLVVVSLISIFTFCAGTAFAQGADEEPTPSSQSTASDSSFLVGVVGSVGLTSVSFENEAPEGIGSKLGFSGGLRAIYNFTPMFGVQPEVLFTQRGFASEMTMGDGMKMSHDVVYNYLQVPLLGRVNFALGDVVTAKVLVGPSFGYFVSGHRPHMEMDMASDEMKMTEADIESDEVNSFEVGAAAGIGADFALGGGSLSTDLRYDRGFTTIDSNDEDADNAVHTGFSFMLGYNYAL